jgi:hypothetical protein
MKHALLIALLLAGCASGPAEDPNAPNITLHLSPYQDALNDYRFSGPVNIQFALSMTNTSNQPVTLDRIEIRTVGSGAYTIRPTTTSINVNLGPGESRSMPISVWGYARGGQMSSTEPVTLRGTAYLRGPAGPFVRLVTEYITPQ